MGRPGAGCCRALALSGFGRGTVLCTVKELYMAKEHGKVTEHGKVKGRGTLQNRRCDEDGKEERTTKAGVNWTNWTRSCYLMLIPMLWSRVSDASTSRQRLEFPA